MTEFFGIWAGTIPGFTEAGGGKFMSVLGLPDRTVQNMVTFMATLRGMHAQDPLAFEVCVRHVASVIEDQRRKEGPYRPTGRPRPLTLVYSGSVTHCQPPVSSCTAHQEGSRRVGQLGG